MELSQSFLHEVEDCPWLAQCGRMDASLNAPDIRRIRNWETALKKISSDGWENTCLKNHNELTMRLHREGRFQDWNKIAVEIKEQVIPGVIARLTEAIHGLQRFPQERERNIIVDVRCNLLTVCMKEHYGERRPDDFYGRLWDIYRTGHLPCYYDGGVFPDGWFEVF